MLFCSHAAIRVIIVARVLEMVKADEDGSAGDEAFPWQAVFIIKIHCSDAPRTTTKKALDKFLRAYACALGGWQSLPFRMLM